MAVTLRTRLGRPVKIDRYEVTKKFEKTFNKLHSAEQERVKAALAAASEDLFNPTL